MATQLSSSPVSVYPNAEHYLDSLHYWSVITAYGLAAAEGVRLSQEHIDILYWLRSEYDKQGEVDLMQILQKLSVMYGPSGGEDYLATLFPQQPITRALKIAGLPVPSYLEEECSALQ